jgi:hypothetical protein
MGKPVAGQIVGATDVRQFKIHELRLKHSRITKEILGKFQRDSNLWKNLKKFSKSANKSLLPGVHSTTKIWPTFDVVHWRDTCCYRKCAQERRSVHL